MILYINVFITNNRSNRRDHVKIDFQTDDRLDIFKYTLASLAVINWSNVFIHSKLDKEYEPRAKELEHYVHQLFTNVEFKTERSEYQKQWQKNCRNVLDKSDDLIWYMCNDDHVFVDSDLNLIQEAQQTMSSDPSKFKSLYFSHWPETLRWFAGKNAQKTGNFLISKRNITDGIQLVNKDLLHNWWFENHYGNEMMRRSDDIMTILPKEKLTEFTCYAPTKEIVRHFDAYGHVRIPATICPPYTIPPGFFENDIKISYCSDYYRKGWVNIDPTNLHYQATNELGTDYKWLIEDIPLFWKDRISKVEIDKQLPIEELHDHHRKNISNMISFRPHFGPWLEESDADPPMEWVF